MGSTIAPGTKGRWARAIADRWFQWRSKRVSLAQLAALDREQRDTIAQDAGVAATDLVALMHQGPDAADLLYRRLAALRLDKDIIKRDDPAMLRDLQRLCSWCESKGRCARDLDRSPNDPAWRGYCPNASTLSALTIQAKNKVYAR